MNRRILGIALLSIVALVVAGCGGSGHLKVTITTAPTTLAAGATANLIATVTHDPKAGGVTWSCTPSDACGSFNPTSTPSGTGTTYTAPAVPPSSTQGVVTILATSATNTARSASVNITITGVATANFVFYASGEENNPLIEGTDSYSIAGVVAIAQDGSGTVVSGEQDYNDGDGNTSPQPAGDTITGGTLVMATDGSGNAILTLNTSNTSLPNGGTEVFALAFANTNHAVIVQFDGSATSSGSYDLQTSTAAPVSASFAFAASGTNTMFDPVCDGGVFSVDASGNITGVFDLNDFDSVPTVSLNNPIPAGVTTGTVDTFGRGVVSGFLFGGASINYYVVGPEVLRLIAVDPTATAVGSAYGQGSTPNFSSGSIGQSVFQIGSSLDGYGAVGQFLTAAEGAARAQGHANTPVREGGTLCSGTGACSFVGEGDYNDLNTGGGGGPIEFSGTYSVAANGYGALNFTTASFGPIETFGVYAVDPHLNILDPNNSATDTVDSGGALIAEMDANLFGTGSIVPQTDVTQASFSGFYAFGGQGDTNGAEFDFVGTGTVTPGDAISSFQGNGALSDPFGVLTDGVESTDAVFTATASGPDAVGRYTLDPLSVAPLEGDTDFAPFTFATVAAYQASGGQLYWVQTDEGSYFLGPIEQGVAPSSDARKAKAKASIKKQ